MRYTIIFDDCDTITQSCSAIFDSVEDAEHYIKFNKCDYNTNNVFSGGIAQIVPLDMDPEKTIDEQAIKTIDIE